MGDVPDVSNRRYALITSFTAGGCAGAAAKTAIAPLDRTKINFQVSSTKNYSLRAAFRFVSNSWRNDGFLSLWRGNSAQLARVVPYAAIQFAAHDHFRHLLGVDVDGSTPYRRALAGSLAGSTAVTCTYPLDTARARLAVASKKEYRTLRSVFFKTARREGGLMRLYGGLVPSLYGSFVYAGFSFFTYGTLKREYYLIYGQDEKMPAYVRMICGACAGIIGQTSSYPLDIVRRRVQTCRTAHFGPRPPMFEFLYHIYKTEGVRTGLFKGLSMNWIKGPISVGISFMVHDEVITILRRLPYFREELAIR